MKSFISRQLLGAFCLLVYVVTLFLVPVCMVSAQEINEAPKFTTWKNFGERMVANAPVHIRESKEKLVMYVAGEVAREMKRQNYTPNYNVGTRITNLWQEWGTCGNCSDILSEALGATGVESRYIMVDSNWIVGPNRNHGALAVMIDGKVVMLDAWQHGRATDSFEGFVGSKWNGMSLEDWAKEMKAQGYVRISSDGGVTLFPVDTDKGIQDMLKPWKEQLDERRAQLERKEAARKAKESRGEVKKEETKPADDQAVVQPRIQKDEQIQSKETKQVEKVSGEESKTSLTDLWDQKMRDLKKQKAERDSQLDDLKTKSDDFDERLKAKKREATDLKKDIGEYEDLVKKGYIPGKAMKDKYDQNKRELVANRKFQDWLNSEREKNLRETETLTFENNSFNMISSLYNGGRKISGSWWESFFGSSEAKDKSEFEAVQSSSDAVLNERRTALEISKGKAESEAARRDIDFQGWLASMSSAYESARAEAQWKRENSWGAWAQSVLLDTVKGISGGFGSGFGNRIGSGIIEHEISKRYSTNNVTQTGNTTAVSSGTDDKKGKGSSGRSHRRKNKDKDTQPDSSQPVVSQTVSPPPVISQSNKPVPGQPLRTIDGKPFQPPPDGRNTANEISPGAAKPPPGPAHWYCFRCGGDRGVDGAGACGCRPAGIGN
ncbi:MAG: hypothetical protein PHR77_14195 [Kiritimatiellae bacterium]|nr:hypothetical protein [Kiritimatiellia bacterium]MDD5519414.1 hypothetical protein [Kiritimatiellia bacterium]